MAKIKISLTEEEAYNLYVLVKESKDTDDIEWDKTMESIYKQLYENI